MSQLIKRQDILVWDAPVRVFHWLMVLCFAGAYITADGERWRLVHVSLGYTMGGLVLFRLVWGFAGTRYARFSSFIRGPAAIIRYMKSLPSDSPEHHIGHNPAGAVAIVLLLGISAVLVGTGWAIYNDIGPGWLEDLHDASGPFMLAVVAVHVAGVIISSWLHRENLIQSMMTGKKEGSPNQGIRRTLRFLATVIVLTTLAFWFLQWQSAP